MNILELIVWFLVCYLLHVVLSLTLKRQINILYFVVIFIVGLVMFSSIRQKQLKDDLPRRLQAAAESLQLEK